FRAVEAPGSVIRAAIENIYLAHMKAAAEFQSVGAQNFGEIVEDLNRVVDLILGKWIHPCRELVRGDTRNTFEARRQHYYARSVCTRRNSERACLWTKTPCGLRIGRF